MKKVTKSRILSAVTLALALSTVGSARAATATGTYTFTGTIDYIAPPPSCTVGSKTIDASYAIPSAGVGSYTKTETVSVNCTYGTPYSVSTPSTQNALNLGGQANFLHVELMNLGKNIGSDPVTGSGTAAGKSIALTMTFRRADGVNLNESTVGAISGTVALTVTY